MENKQLAALQDIGNKGSVLICFLFVFLFWCWQARNSPSKFTLINFANWQIFKIWQGARLHFPIGAFSLREKKEAAVGLPGVTETELSTNPITESIAIFEPAGWSKHSIFKFCNLQHSFFGNFKEHTLISRTASNINRAARIYMPTIPRFSAEHRLKHASHGQLKVTGVFPVIPFDNLGSTGSMSRMEEEPPQLNLAGSRPLF
jgi:hypothetical protein